MVLVWWTIWVPLGLHRARHAGVGSGLRAFSWVPLHARHVVAAEGFTDFAAKPRRLDHFLHTYGWSATAGEFLDVVEARIKAHADGIRDIAASGDEA